MLANRADGRRGADIATTPTPHDCFFRENCVRPAVARRFLRHTLPPALLDDLDLDRLVISPDTFVTEALRKVYSDLVYQIPYRNLCAAIRLGAARYFGQRHH
ncbi:hypothetical protein Thi970DRAFT_02927 [Thiorhodovibrio frisius]|uniref:Transposase (putative) YhgA-like domain-containing protein n=2 Tax=Thiorhodovibrio frisius TaxID=631362 RepID=H8Z287_9GAMM|nr:hypothetical protein Thi970DRAFT_02927 [Thiorhodovibrio frisius]WPL22405.1 Putative transposase, YhgA-like [Thiorhodovibrio frisius]